MCIYAQTQIHEYASSFFVLSSFYSSLLLPLFYSSFFQGLLTYSLVYLTILSAFVLLQLQFLNFANKRESKVMARQEY